MGNQHAELLNLAIIATAALGTSVLTFFSGFGLGTLLAPVLMLFLPAEVAVVTTGLVHTANNIFKVSLFGRHADWSVVWRFGMPAICAAIPGAWLLVRMQTLLPIHSYRLMNMSFHITPIKLVLAVLLFVFTLSEMVAYRKPIDKKWLPLGGLLSGFFGGLSGIQGALRTAFLTKLGLNKEAFIASGVVVSTMIDISRLTVYIPMLQQNDFKINRSILVVATLSAIAGALIGFKIFKKITIKALKTFVSVMLLAFALALGLGLIG